MIAHKLQPGRRKSVLEAVSFGQLHPRDMLQAVEHGVWINIASSKLSVTMGAVLQRQIVRLNGVPKARQIHWPQPVVDIFNVVKVFHLPKISRLRFAAQFWIANPRSAPCPS